MSEPYVGGKGDRQRPCNKALYDAGYAVAFAKTPAEERAAREWLTYLKSPEYIKHLGDSNASD